MASHYGLLETMLFCYNNLKCFYFMGFLFWIDFDVNFGILRPGRLFVRLENVPALLLILFFFNPFLGILDTKFLLATDLLCGRTESILTLFDADLFLLSLTAVCKYVPDFLISSVFRFSFGVLFLSLSKFSLPLLSDFGHVNLFY